MWFRAAPALVLILFAGCSGPYSSPAVSAKEETPIPVQTITAKPEGIPEVVSATGELLAEEQATIGGKVPGRVTKLHVDLGTQVRAGQVLAEIEKDDYELRVRQAEALVNQARARLGILDRTDDNVAIEETALVRQAAAALKEARFIFQTTEQLQKEGVMSRIDMEKAQVRFQGAEAAYQAATEEVMQLKAQLNERRTQVALARQNLTDCVIRAPFAGAVTRRIAGLGEYLAVNAPVVTLVRQHPLRLRSRSAPLRRCASGSGSMYGLTAARSRRADTWSASARRSTPKAGRCWWRAKSPTSPAPCAQARSLRGPSR
jgi:multidrug efflux pump subunit AcrA (membrane-fusion protein)